MKGRFTEIEIKIFYPLFHSPNGHMARAETIQNQYPGAPSKSPCGAGSQNLGHPPLISQAISRELNGKWTRTGAYMG